jgi:hypothetical protein
MGISPVVCAYDRPLAGADRTRTPERPAAERKGAFARLAFYRDGAIFTGKFAGENARGRHPNGDEIVQIVDGAATLQIMTAIVHAQGAMVAIVPQGAWHRLEAPDGLSLTVIPRPTEHLTAAVALRLFHATRAYLEASGKPEAFSAPTRSARRSSFQSRLSFSTSASYQSGPQPVMQSHRGEAKDAGAEQRDRHRFGYRRREFANYDLAVAGLQIGDQDLVAAGVEGTPATSRATGVRHPPTPAAAAVAAAATRAAKKDAAAPTKPAASRSSLKTGVCAATKTAAGAEETATSAAGAAVTG